MPTHQQVRLSKAVVAMTIMLLVAVAGCRRAEQFNADQIWAKANELTPAQSESIQSVLAELFGTPDAPKIPNDDLVSRLFDIHRLEQASGKVISEEVGVTQGLYGRHCARCHGITGNGRGPTALYQSPYPRDFRRGIFKWKSTARAAKPTDDDLFHTITNGVHGTSMPSFALLTEDERLTLIQYVKYLSLRGELEQELVTYVAEELDIEETLANDDPEITTLLKLITREWELAAIATIEVSPDLLAAGSAKRGKALYASERAGCLKCHGKEGSGLSVLDSDYDTWNKRRFELQTDADQELEALLLDDLPVRTSVGKRLTNVPLRGKADQESLYRRIHQGINGSPMPAVGSVSDGDLGALSNDEVADLVAYVATLVKLPKAEEGSDE